MRERIYEAKQKETRLRMSPHDYDYELTHSQVAHQIPLSLLHTKHKNNIIWDKSLKRPLSYGIFLKTTVFFSKYRSRNPSYRYKLQNAKSPVYLLKFHPK